MMPADGMIAAAEKGDFGTSRWQLSPNPIHYLAVYRKGAARIFASPAARTRLASTRITILAMPATSPRRCPVTTNRRMMRPWSSSRHAFQIETNSASVGRDRAPVAPTLGGCCA
jgi:hypothetical protein